MPPRKLTEKTIKDAACTGANYRLFDGEGLYMEVSPTGRKWWRYKYRVNGKEKRLALGVYPDVKLNIAREKLADARKLVSRGIDPIEHRRAVQTTLTSHTDNAFEVVVREWHTKNLVRWTPDHARDIIKKFEKDLFPWIGNKVISEISATDLLEQLNKIQERGANETAHRLLQYCTKVCRYGVLTGRLEKDITVGLKEALRPGQSNPNILLPSLILKKSLN